MEADEGLSRWGRRVTLWARAASWSLISLCLLMLIPRPAWAQMAWQSPAGSPPGRGHIQTDADLFLLPKGELIREGRGPISRHEIITYTIQAGDTLWSIARKFNLDIDTLRWCNPEIERNPDHIWVGQSVVVPPRRGALYTVKRGDTLESIAKAWGVAPIDITAEPLNHMSEPYKLTPGQRLFIPNGRKNLTRWLRKPSPAPGYDFAWPLVGVLTQGYSAHHRAIDIGTVYGAPVYAARGGVVVHAAWARTGYGYTVIINHGGGLMTLYAHLKGTWVHEGERVRRGQLIGEVGSTGRSTGPHVPFEIRVNGRRVNPLNYLPPKP